MAKSRSRKPSANQRSKQTIEAAKYLKSKGFISKKANLHSGRYVSPGVLRKVIKFQSEREAGYKTIKAPRKILLEAKENGFTVTNGRLVVPNDKHFIKRIFREGLVAGVTPVKGGQMERVILPLDLFDLTGFIDRLDGPFVDDYKRPGEQFAFSYYGHMSYVAFPSTLGERGLRKYLERYNLGVDRVTDVANFRNFQLFRLNPVDISKFLPSQEQRQAAAKKRRQARGAPVHRRQGVKVMHPARLARYQKRHAEQEANRRAKFTPEKLELERAKSRERMARKRAEKKNK